MAYIWDDYDEDIYYYMPQERQSYYQELWRRGGKYVPVNIYNRFLEVFYSDFINSVESIDYLHKEDDRFRDIMNISIHFLAQMDRIRGITLEDIKMSLIYDDIVAGIYGEEMRKQIEKLKYRELYIILKELVKTSDDAYKQNLFDEVLILVYGKVIIYKERSTDKTIVYIEDLKTDYKEYVFKIICFLFADIGLNIEVFWANTHFGIIEADSTMKIDKMCVY